MDGAHQFQSSVDQRMPIRLMHYVACFYDHLLKTRQTTPVRGLPPVLPIVLYNGSPRWSARQDVYELVQPEPPAFLRAYQPHLRYYLIDEARYTDEELTKRATPLSGVFGIENATGDRQALQRAVDRIVAIIQADPNKQRIDEIVTRWLKRHLQWLGSEINLERLNSVVEDKEMLAENLENWAKKERQEGRHEGVEGTLRKLIELKFGALPEWVDESLAQASDEQLDTWVARILTVDSLDDLFIEQ